MLKKVFVGGVAVCLLVYSVIYFANPAHAETLQSNNFQFSETVLGSGGLVQSNSANYQGSAVIGDLSVGTSSSSNFQLATGHTTTNDPNLSVSVNGTINFSPFSSATTATATATFTVLNYTTYGYIVQIVGNTPSNGSTAISPMDPAGPTFPGASVAGTSQFGINLVANTSPVSVGTNPDNGQFGFGTVAGNYGTPNEYRYVSGETIAQATRNSGVTTYTITYLVNVPALTPGGIYTSNQTLIVTGTY
jgi:hypothetical protein